MRERGAARNRRVLLVWLVSAWAAAAGCATPRAGSGEERAPRAATASFAVYALSRGRGVPEATRGAWQPVWTHARGRAARRAR